MTRCSCALAVLVGCASADATAPNAPGFSVAPTVTWTATGGTIDQTGLYTAGPTPGIYRVIAAAGDKADTSEVTISAPATACASLPLCAGENASGPAGSAIALAGTVPTGWKAFWTVVSGPGIATFGHDDRTIEFEDGTTDEWTGTPTTPCGDGTQCMDGPWGRHEANTAITSSMKHRGAYGWAAQNVAALGYPYSISAKLLRWGNWPVGHTTAYWQAWMYFPADHSAGEHTTNFINLVQWKETVANYNPIFAISAKAYNGVDEWWMYYPQGSEAWSDRPGVPIAKGAWTHVATWYFGSKTAGQIWVWINGKLIYKGTGNPTTHNTLSSHSTRSNGGFMWGVGNYGYPEDGVVYWDDIQVSVAGGPSVAATTFTASTPGVYVVRLTGSGGALGETHTDEATVTVGAP